MFIVTEIESLAHTLRAKLGTLSTDAEMHLANFLGLAKDEEAAAEAKVEAEIAHLQSLGYSVAKIQAFDGALVDTRAFADTTNGTVVGAETGPAA